MATQRVLTVTAEDRPGIVEALAEAVAAENGNWIDSRMARLGGVFAGIVRVEAPHDRISKLEDALLGLRSKGILVNISPGVDLAPPAGQRAELVVTGLDHPGIVRDVTRVLAAQHVSVDDLVTHLFAGSMGGEHMFQARLEVVIPPNLSLESVRVALEHIAHDIMVDLDLSPAKHS